MRCEGACVPPRRVACPFPTAACDESEESVRRVLVIPAVFVVLLAMLATRKPVAQSLPGGSDMTQDPVITTVGLEPPAFHPSRVLVRFREGKAPDLLPGSASAIGLSASGSPSDSSEGTVNGITRITIMKLERCRSTFTRKRPTPGMPHEQSKSRTWSIRARSVSLLISLSAIALV